MSKYLILTNSNELVRVLPEPEMSLLPTAGITTRNNNGTSSASNRKIYLKRRVILCGENADLLGFSNPVGFFS